LLVGVGVVEGGPESSHALLMYEAALQELRSVDCEVASGWWWVVVMLLLAKANVYTKFGDRRARKRLLNAILHAGQSSTLIRDDFIFTCQMIRKHVNKMYHMQILRLVCI
jgi:hypothetical protein